MENCNVEKFILKTYKIRIFKQKHQVTELLYALLYAIYLKTVFRIFFYNFEAKTNYI